jgi:hypothetical protein
MIASEYRISCPGGKIFAYMGRKPYAGGLDLSAFLTGNAELKILSS